MKTRIIFLFSIFAFILLFQKGDRPAMAGSAAAPKLILPQTDYAFDTVHEGESLRHPFKLQNKGSSPLDIIEVKTD